MGRTSARRSAPLRRECVSCASWCVSWPSDAERGRDDQRGARCMQVTATYRASVGRVEDLEIEQLAHQRLIELDAVAGGHGLEDVGDGTAIEAVQHVGERARQLERVVGRISG